MITFARQRFARAAGGALCPSSALLSGTFGPVRDISARGHPRVFVT